MSERERRCKSCNDSYSGQMFWTCDLCGGESCGNCAEGVTHEHIDCNFTDGDRKREPPQNSPTEYGDE